MGEWMIDSLEVGVTFVLNMINMLAHFPFPGTEIPIAVIFLAPAGLFLLWRVFLGWIFDLRGD